MNYEQLRISGPFILLVIYLGVTLYLIFGKNIPLPKTRFLFRGRKKVFIVAEILLLVIYCVSFYYLIDYANNFNDFVSLMMFSFFSLAALINLIEEYVSFKEAKGYFHGWTFLIFMISVLSIIGWTM